jgi:hypothetical protein
LVRQANRASGRQGAAPPVLDMCAFIERLDVGRLMDETQPHCIAEALSDVIANRAN